MVEDAVYSSTIASFRRAANPLKVIKQGDANTGWIPDPSTESELLRMLAQAELDPHAYLVTHYGVNFEQWGGSERAITLSREHDTIEKVKLMALGLSKSFMTGEVTYASSMQDAEIITDSGELKRIDQFKIGDPVTDRFGDVQAVTDILKYPSPDEMTEITVYGRKKLVLTDNHRLPVFRSSLILQAELRADEVVVGDFLMIPRKFEVSETQTTPSNLVNARLQGNNALGPFTKEIMHWNLELKLELVRGVFFGLSDLPYMTDLFDMSYSTTSKALVSQLELLLAQLGYACYIEQVDSIDEESFYTIETLGSDGKSVTAGLCMDADYLYLPVLSVQKIPVDKEKDPFVYSLTVSNSHSYMISNVASFNSAKSGLQVFLRRLLSMRQFFEQSWILPKFFAPIVEINDWVKSTPAEVNNRIKVKRTAQEAAERGLMITPKIKWRNKLDPTVDAEVLQAYSQLKNFGFDISQSSVGSAVSLNWEDELRKKAVEFKIREGILSETLGETLKQKFEQAQQAGAKPPGGAGGGAMPPGAAGGAPGGAGAKPKQEPGGKPVSNPPGSADSNGAGSDGIEGPGSVGIA
jgi:hypothetical protein